MSEPPRCYQCGCRLGDINAACPNCLPNWMQRQTNSLELERDWQGENDYLRRELSLSQEENAILAAKLREVEAQLAQAQHRIERLSMEQTLDEIGSMQRIMQERDTAQANEAAIRERYTTLAAAAREAYNLACAHAPSGYIVQIRTILKAALEAGGETNDQPDD